MTMVQTLEYLRESPSQTASPYVHIGCTPNFTGIEADGGDVGTQMKTGPAKGQEIILKGTALTSIYRILTRRFYRYLARNGPSRPGLCAERLVSPRRASDPF